MHHTLTEVNLSYIETFSKIHSHIAYQAITNRNITINKRHILTDNTNRQYSTYYKERLEIYKAINI